MKFSESWLRSHVPTDASRDELSAVLTAIAAAAACRPSSASASSFLQAGNAAAIASPSKATWIGRRRTAGITDMARTHREGPLVYRQVQ